jgi:Uma2 family endonuclease
MPSVATTIAIGDELEIPLPIRNLSDFREWARSDDFPERGRIDYIRGRIEIDLRPGDIWFHSAPKTEIGAQIATAAKLQRLGLTCLGGMRWSSIAGDVSSEPDTLLVRYDSLRSGKVTLVPSPGGEPHECNELEGPVELIVEIVSDETVRRDTQRLPPAYFAAGVDEFWLVDVRPESFLFQIHRRGKTKWKPAATRPDGSQHSTVLDRWYRLEQHAEPAGVWMYDLMESE